MYIRIKITNIDRVITSWITLSWGRLNSVYPIRFAGTCKRYSSRAIPQLTNAAIYHGLAFRFLRCPYQANVINIFDKISKIVVFSMTGMASYFFFLKRKVCFLKYE